MSKNAPIVETKRYV